MSSPMKEIAARSSYLENYEVSESNIQDMSLIVLECIDHIKNHSKRYIIQHETPYEPFFTAFWGRIGLQPKSKTYYTQSGSIPETTARWVGEAMLSKYREKLRHGYSLVTIQRFGAEAQGSVPDFYREE